MQTDAWLPLTEYALRSGISISTLRRKIKANSIAYKMEEGRYLIRCDEMDAELPEAAFSSSDTIITNAVSSEAILEMEQKLKEQFQKANDETALRMRALDARVTGLAKKLEIFTEQMAEVKMLVKLFEEKLDQRG